MLLSSLQALLGWWSAGSSLGSNHLERLFGPWLSAEAQIFVPGPEWTVQVRQRWSTYNEPTFIGAIKPATVGDIHHTVKIAAANDIPFFATGGGHGVSDYHRFEGITIDLSNFKSIRINHTSDTVTVGASAEFSELSRVLYQAGRELPLASCACVGVIGATLGAGISPLQGHRGLMIDALESVQMVTADGELVSASAEENPDLFWALRGAGANFGIVVEATFRTYDHTNHGQVTLADLVFPASANQSFYETLATYGKDMPNKLAITAVAVYNRDLGMPVLVAHSTYFGPQAEAEQVLAPFKHLRPVVQNIVTVPQTDLLPPEHGSCTPNQRINVYTIALRQISPPTFVEFYEHMVDLWQRYPDYDGRLLIERYAQGAVAAKPHDSTAYPWRDAIALMNIESFYVQAAHDEAINGVVAAGRDKFAETSGYDTLSTYVNFAHGDEGPESWYGAQNLPKLSMLKRKWDPRGLFSWHNPIPLEGSQNEL